MSATPRTTKTNRRIIGAENLPGCVLANWRPSVTDYRGDSAGHRQKTAASVGEAAESAADGGPDPTAVLNRQYRSNRRCKVFGGSVNRGRLRRSNGKWRQKNCEFLMYFWRRTCRRRTACPTLQYSSFERFRRLTHEEQFESVTDFFRKCHYPLADVFEALTCRSRITPVTQSSSG